MAKSSKTPQQVGKEFEGEVQDELQSYQARHPTVTLRLYDTRSAGNYIPSQPGDFISVYFGNVNLLEVKSSLSHCTLEGKRAPLTELFDAEQVAKMRLWHRAGANVWVIFKDQNSDHIEVWSGNYIAHCFITPRLCADRKHVDAWYADFRKLGPAVRYMLGIEL